jgi:hypothetical protein
MSKEKIEVEKEEKRNEEKKCRRRVNIGCVNKYNVLIHL